MPANTPIFGFPYPLGTDPVAQGDNVIQQLAEDVETVMDSIGLWLIGSFSNNNTTSITCNNVFSSKYRFYRLVFMSTGGSGGGTDSFLQMNVNGTPVTTNYNYHAIFSSNTAGPSRTYSTGQSAFLIGNFSSGNSTFSADIYEPNINGSTSLVSNYQSWGTTANFGATTWGVHTVGTQFTGFVVSNANAFTGTIRVYGYRD